MCPWKKLVESVFFMPHRVFGLWKKTRKSSWCNLGVSLWSCSTNVAAMGCWNTVRKGMRGLSFFHQMQLCSLLMFSCTSEFPYVSTHTSKQWRTNCKVIPSNIYLCRRIELDFVLYATNLILNPYWVNQDLWRFKTQQSQSWATEYIYPGNEFSMLSTRVLCSSADSS